ncbi:MAG TPA: glycosyltransferase family 2 protein [Capillimicrobium sp.]|nr:glycosyltransferase family 2 protein [Capillimicrobium sp.]
MAQATLELSVVVPVYGCAGCVEELHRRVMAATEGIEGGVELIFVDDRSPDGSWPKLRAIAEADPRVRAVRMSRNFGQHAAITAGLMEARGRWIAVMDCDLQDPPEQIPLLYGRAREGHDIVFGRRRRRGASPFRRIAARTYFRLMNAFTNSNLQGDYGTFSVISHKVAQAYLALGERDRHYLFILNWLGFAHTEVEYEHGERGHGESSYSFGRLVRHALDGVFFQTTVLLRWVVYLGFAISTLGILAAAYFAIANLTGASYPGWTSLAVFTLTIGGFTIVSTGITGLYIGKVFEQVKERPLFVVDERVGAPVEHTEREQEQERELAG